MNCMRCNIFEILMVLSGGLVFLLSLLLDLFYSGSPGIGFEQLAGMVIGCFIILIGIRHLLFSDLKKWDWLLFSVYLCGILYAGLRPSSSIDIHQIHLFGMDSLSKRDLTMNIAGFIPLGFLSMTILGFKNNHKRSRLIIVLAIAIGMTVSATIESLQFLWVAGRYSSAYDLACNVAGTIIGVTGYLIVEHYSLYTAR